MPIYGKNLEKSSSPEPRMPLGWIFAQIVGDGRFTKVDKIKVVHWHLTLLWGGQVCFPMHLYGLHTFVWEKCWEFRMTSPQKPLGQFCSNFIWSLHGAGEWKIAKMVTIHWQRWPQCPYMIKTFKHLLQKRMPSGWNFAQKIGVRSSTKIAKMSRTLTFDLLTARSSLLPYAFVLTPYICMEKMLIISNDFSSEASGPMLLKFHVEPPWGRGTKDC